MLSGTPHTFIGSTTLVVRGPDHAVDRRALAERILAVAGVEAVTADPRSGSVTVRATQPVDRADVVEAAESAGFTVVG
jgi:hypothetical protein